MLSDYERQRARGILFYGTIAIVLALAVLATCAQPADAARRPPAKRACVGVVVRTTEGWSSSGGAMARPVRGRRQ